MPWIAEKSAEISGERLRELMRQTVAEARRRICARPKRVLLLPPDITRMHSGSGRLTEMLYQELAGEADVHIIPTLGQHVPHTPEQNRTMFGTVPNDRIHVHDWRGGCVEVGEIPAEVVREKTGGVADWPIPIFVNRMLMEESWDLIINIGHVVPHEVLGFANHNKNYFIGLGGKKTICASHMAAACCGIENNLGRLITPLRACFNWAEERFLGRLPDVYVQVVLANKATNGSANDEFRMTNDEQDNSSFVIRYSSLRHTGLYVGDDMETYLAAARQSGDQNITVFDEPVKKIVCVMQADEFHSTWVANKAVYRTRMAIADRGELVIIAPGLVRFGEQPEVDALIRKYGYCGTTRVMHTYREGEAPAEPPITSGSAGASPSLFHDLAHAAAHLIHGSTEGRFRVTYAPGGLTRAEIEGVGYGYMELDSAVARYRPDDCRPGWNKSADGEPFYFIPTPSAGLWATRDRLDLAADAAN
jgi:nickel-dependent lactate racemase